MLKLHPGTAMVAFFLPEDRATMLATADGEPAGNLHVTSIYFGDTAEIQEQRNAVLRLVKVLSIDTPPFSGSLNRLSHFGPDDDGLMAVVLEVDSPELQEFHDSLAASLEEAGIPWNQKFPNYRPHVTLGYWPEDEIPDRYSKPGTIDPIQVTFTEASVKWDGERFDNPLGECVVASVQEFDWRNQPRDSQGRWAETGSWGKQVKSTPILSFVRDGADAWRLKKGRPSLGSTGSVMADEDTSKEIAAAYAHLPNNDRKAHASFTQFAKEIEEQADYVTKPVSEGGLGIKIEVVDKDPYATHRELVDDVLHHRRIKVLSTATTGAHDFLTNEQNDKFRAVHDLFGHVATGRPFDRHGEEAAWLEHASMFSELARGAMTTETRGQNSMLINTGKFADQKIALLPKKFYSDKALQQVKRRQTQRVVHLVAEASFDLTEGEDNSLVEDARNPIAVLQASAVQVEEVRLTATQALEFACHDDSCAPPPAGTGGSLPGPSLRRVGGRVPATRPTTVGGLKKFDPGTPIRIEPSLHGDKQRAAILQRIASVPGFEDTVGLDVEAGETAVLERLSRNIQENFERSVEDYGLERTLKHSEWYPAAHDAGVSWAKEFGFDEDAVFAALAVLSPQADWGDNVAWSRFVAEKIHDQENIEITQEIVDAYEAAQQIAYRGQVKEFESGKRPTKPKAPVPSGLPVGNMLSEVSDEQAAQVIRGMGNAEGLMQGLFGNPKTKARANRDSAIANAVSVLRDPTTENISSRLGNEHKVRSFYNNIRDPMDTKFEDVTADTHHFGAAFGHPWSGSSAFLSSGKRDKDGNPLANKNIWGAVGTGDTGASGAYALVVEATRIATKRVNAKYKTDLRPAQMQSVVWEYHRNSWPARARKSVVGAIETVRTDEASGSISHDEAMSRIDAIREAAPGAAPRNKLLEQMLGTYKPTKKTRQRVIQND